MLKIYRWKVTCWQFEEDKAPADAVELTPPAAAAPETETPKAKSRTAANKSRKGADK